MAERVAWITGGTGAIGAACAAHLTKDGWDVVLSGRDEGRGRRLVGHLNDGVGSARFVRADVTVEADIASAVADIEGHEGRLDGLVTAAGIGVVAPLLGTESTDFEEILRNNVLGTWLAVRYAVPLLRQSRGAVVTVSSDAGIVGEAAIGAYSVAKAAVVMLTRMLAIDCAPNVRVNAVAPGFTEPGMRQMPHKAGPVPMAEPLPPLGRYASGNEIADVVAFLLGS